VVSMVVPKVQKRPPPKQQEAMSSSSSFISSYYVLLIVKILLILIILFTFPKLVTASIKLNTKERRQNQKLMRMNKNYGNHHHIYKRYKYKLRSLRNECQNDSICKDLIPEESLNCVNLCISNDCYTQIFNSTTTVMIHENVDMDHHSYYYDDHYSTTSSVISSSSSDTTATMMTVVRVPLEDGEIDVVRAKEFEQCVIDELREMKRLQQQQLQQQQVQQQ
jgi:hypothetical protein